MRNRGVCNNVSLLKREQVVKKSLLYAPVEITVENENVSKYSIISLWKLCVFIYTFSSAFDSFPTDIKMNPRINVET